MDGFEGRTWPDGHCHTISVRWWNEPILFSCRTALVYWFVLTVASHFPRLVENNWSLLHGSLWVIGLVSGNVSRTPSKFLVNILGQNQWFLYFSCVFRNEKTSNEWAQHPLWKATAESLWWQPPIAPISWTMPCCDLEPSNIHVEGNMGLIYVSCTYIYI